MRNPLLFLFAAVLLFAGCSAEAPHADLVLRNGRVVTLDASVGDGTAIAVRADTIAFVGDEAAIETWIGANTEVIDLEGQLAIPGLIEGHAHFMGIGRAQMILDLTTAQSWQDIVDQVEGAAAETEPGEWIVGRGWHQEKWTSTPEGSIDGVPTHHDLSAVSPNNPVLLGHASGHASFANEEAMRVSGISSETPDPAGGEIVRDARGEPSGLLRETASGLASRALNASQQQRTEEEILAEQREMVRLAAQELLENGITSFHDAGSSFATVDLLQDMAEAGELPVRLYVMLRVPNEALAARVADYRIEGAGDDRLTVRSIKRSIDGALGSHGAWLLEPYTDKPESAGLNTAAPEDVARTAEIALEHGFQLNVHAIGDRANREVLDLFQNAFGGPDTEDRRWRIEHAQHLHPDDIPRFAELGVIASMQGVHATSDGPWVPEKLGDQRAMEGAYMWRTLWDSGAIVTNGTDAPVEDVDPIASYYSTVTRQPATTDEPFYPGEALTRLEALESYTINNAFAAFEEGKKGTLTPGKYADITVLSSDILTIPAESIPDTRVVMTIVGGQIEYRAE